MLIKKTAKMKKEDFLKLLSMLGINEKELLSLSLETGFVQRVRKIDSLDFLYSLVSESMNGITSYNDIACLIEIENRTSISRQAIWKKVTEKCANYFKLVLALIILSKANKQLPNRKLTQYKFKRILIQDSTIVRLPQRLFGLFSGVSNGHSAVCNARIQGIFDLVSGRFISFTINPYSKNDLDSAPDMEIMKDDLTLRDRGYLTYAEIKRHVLSGAHCIYRHKTKMQLLDFETEEQIDILSTLKKTGSIDMLVKLNDSERTIVRLVAKPVDKETADNRRMKAKKEMRGHCPGKLFLELQAWTIFITTVPADQAGFDDLLSIYGLRWRIETIFKCWKSNLSFEYIHNVSSNQLIIILISRMIFFLIITQIIYTPCKNLIIHHIKRDLSLLKLTKYINRHPAVLISIIQELITYRGELNRSIKSIAHNCVYDKRKRHNFEQKLSLLIA
jgi:hypothetical protein